MLGVRANQPNYISMGCSLAGMWEAEELLPESHLCPLQSGGWPGLAPPLDHLPFGSLGGGSCQIESRNTTSMMHISNKSNQEEAWNTDCCPLRLRKGNQQYSSLFSSLKGNISIF
jgi:hypothetical protein